MLCIFLYHLNLLYDYVFTYFLNNCLKYKVLTPDTFGESCIYLEYGIKILYELLHYTQGLKKYLKVQIKINFHRALCVPRNLQRLFTLECLLIRSQIPECWWGQASVRLFNTYVKKDYKIHWTVTQAFSPQHHYHSGLNNLLWGASCAFQDG